MRKCETEVWYGLGSDTLCSIISDVYIYRHERTFLFGLGSMVVTLRTTLNLIFRQNQII
jgi:hypothetical protein